MRELAVVLAIAGSMIAYMRGDPSLIVAAMVLGCGAGLSLSRR
jgi:hypothetical protein